MIAAAEYLDFVEREYLSDFIASGGAAVKFAVAPDNAAQSLRSGLVGRGLAHGYSVASVDAGSVRVHMIDRVFVGIAEQIDWDDRARAFVVNVLGKLGFRVPGDGDLTLEHLAAFNDYDVNELWRVLDRALQEEILKDYEMAREFRVAMLRLCQAQVDRSDATRTEREFVLLWLRGELRLISSLKQARIFQKIARHNARDMLLSLPRWLVKTGKTGLVLDLDIRRCAISKRPDDSLVFYSKAAALDVYEVLRQLIDATDELTSSFVLVTAAPETLTDPKRGIEGWHIALKLRIWDEVRDRERTNPLAALIRIADVSEARAVQ